MPVRSMAAGGAHESHQLVAQRDPLGQIHAQRTTSVLAQSMHPDSLSGRSCVSRRLARLLGRCHCDTVAEQRE